MDIDPTITKFIERARVARLATANSRSIPHLVPVVFVFDGMHFILPIDEKSKKTKPENLRRIRNINENPNVALLIDEYSEDWTALRFLMVQGKATIKNSPHENQQPNDIQEKLIAKYPQYQKIGIGKMCIVIEPKKIVSWQNTHQSNA